MHYIDKSKIIEAAVHESPIPASFPIVDYLSNRIRMYSNSAAVSEINFSEQFIDAINEK